jgi:hypothetical protein
MTGPGAAGDPSRDGFLDFGSGLAGGQRDHQRHRHDGQTMPALPSTALA